MTFAKNVITDKNWEIVKLIRIKIKHYTDQKARNTDLVRKKRMSTEEIEKNVASFVQKRKKYTD